MSYIFTNAPAILSATIASLVIGALYRLSLPAGTIARSALSTTGFIMLTFSAELWLASILAGALILAPGGGSPWVMALASAVVIWIGFVFPTLLVTLSYRSQPLGRSLLDCACWLVAMLAQAAVLHAIGVKAAT